MEGEVVKFPNGLREINMSVGTAGLRCHAPGSALTVSNASSTTGGVSASGFIQTDNK